MKFVVVNNASLGYRQTHLSPKKMNNLDAVDLFSLLPVDIKLKIIDNHEECREIEMECWNCNACKFKIPNGILKEINKGFGPPPVCPACCLKYKIMGEFCGADDDYARENWRNMKEEMNEGVGGFIIKHRYNSSFCDKYYYTQSPLINPGDYHTNHKIIVIYLNIIKVNKKSIKYVSAEKMLTGYETISDMKDWFNHCHNSTFAESAWDNPKIGRVNTSNNWDEVETKGKYYTFNLANIVLLDTDANKNVLTRYDRRNALF